MAPCSSFGLIQVVVYILLFIFFIFTYAAKLQALASTLKWASGDLNYSGQAARRHFMHFFCCFSCFKNQSPSTSAVIAATLCRFEAQEFFCGQKNIMALSICMRVSK